MNDEQKEGSHDAAPRGARGLGAALRAAAPFTWARLLSNAIREELCERLGLLPAEVEEGSRFMDLGIDSLVAVEMQTILATETGIPLKSTVIFDYPTIGRLVTYLIQQMESRNQDAVPAPKVEPETVNADAPREGAQVARELENELREIQALLGGAQNG
jgi:acyl carrier protein